MPISCRPVSVPSKVRLRRVAGSGCGWTSFRQLGGLAFCPECRLSPRGAGDLSAVSGAMTPETADKGDREPRGQERRPQRSREPARSAQAQEYGPEPAPPSLGTTQAGRYDANELTAGRGRRNQQGRRSTAAMMPRQAPRPQPRRRPVPAPPAEPHRRPRRARFQATRGGTAGRSRNRRSMQGRGRPGRRWRLVAPGDGRGARRPAEPRGGRRRGGRRRGGHGRQDREDHRGDRGVGGRRAGHGGAVAA